MWNRPPVLNKQKSIQLFGDVSPETLLTMFSYPGTTPTMFFTASSPKLKTPVITFVNAPTTSVLSWNRTLYIECCSEISINLFFRSQCYFASIFYSTAYVFRIISFCFLSCILYYVACAFVICLIKYLLTYLLHRVWLYKPVIVGLSDV